MNSPSKNIKRNNYSKGRFSEWIAILFLSLKFYRIISWRQKSQFGEIDIIAKKGNKIVFCEVKARKSKDLAIRAISIHQQRRIKNAAQAFIKRTHWAQKCTPRFDVVLIVNGCFPNHIESAF